MPPPLALLVLAIMLIAFRLAFSATGTARWLSIYRCGADRRPGIPSTRSSSRCTAMYERGIMPVQMSYAGCNFDIVTGIGAVARRWLVATGRGRASPLRLWNILGSSPADQRRAIAILATPLFRYFGDDHLNVWVTYPPFVWLPAVMVLAALAGHLVIFQSAGISNGHERP